MCWLVLLGVRIRSGLEEEIVNTACPQTVKKHIAVGESGTVAPLLTIAASAPMASTPRLAPIACTCTLSQDCEHLAANHMDAPPAFLHTAPYACSPQFGNSILRPFG